MSPVMPLATRFVSALLIAALTFSSPGSSFYGALAQTVGSVNSGTAVVPVVPVSPINTSVPLFGPVDVDVPGTLTNAPQVLGRGEIPEFSGGNVLAPAAKGFVRITGARRRPFGQPQNLTQRRPENGQQFNSRTIGEPPGNDASPIIRRLSASVPGDATRPGVSFEGAASSSGSMFDGSGKFSLSNSGWSGLTGSFGVLVRRLAGFRRHVSPAIGLSPALYANSRSWENDGDDSDGKGPRRPNRDPNSFEYERDWAKDFAKLIEKKGTSGLMGKVFNIEIPSGAERDLVTRILEEGLKCGFLAEIGKDRYLLTASEEPKDRIVVAPLHKGVKYFNNHNYYDALVTLSEAEGIGLSGDPTFPAISVMRKNVAARHFNEILSFWKEEFSSSSDAQEKKNLLAAIAGVRSFLTEAVYEVGYAEPAPSQKVLSDMERLLEELESVISEGAGTDSAREQGKRAVAFLNEYVKGLKPSDDPASASGDGPASKWAAKFERLFSKSLVPGEAFTSKKPSPRASKTAKIAVRHNHVLDGVLGSFVAQLGGNEYIFAVPGKLPNPSDETDRAEKLIYKGVTAFNQGNYGSALDSFYNATNLYLQNINGVSDPRLHNARLTTGMFSNSAVRFYRKMLDAFTIDILKPQVKSHQWARDLLVVAADAGGYLDKAVHAVGRPDPEPAKEVLSNLRLLIEEMKNRLPKNDDHSREGHRLIGFLEVYVNSLDPALNGLADSPVPQDVGRPDQKRLPAGQEQVNPAENEKLERYSLDPKQFQHLCQYGINLTLQAIQGTLNPVIGRKKEIGQLALILTRWQKSNAALVGEAGVGKTSIVEGLAQAIVAGKVPSLEGKIILKLDLGALVAGTMYRGQFEQRLKGILSEAARLKGKLILYTEEMHNLLGLGSAQGSADAANLIKPALSQGDISLIGDTTLDDFRRIEKDKALARRFRFMMIEAPSKAETIEILKGLSAGISKHHKVSFEDDAIKAAVELSERYVTERQFPDKAIDLLDETAARVCLSGDRNVVTADDIAEMVSQWTGIPIGRISKSDVGSLKKLESELRKRIINQGEAVEKVAKAIRRNRSGLGDPNRPIGSFIFLGPTGVGKTEVARVTAEQLFGSKDAMIRFDMSEYMEKHNVSRLIGAPPGYVGYEEAGQLTERVRRKPYSVLLFDEIEKAHSEVLNVLLQILDEGVLTDARGNKVNFKNTIIIMTSNIGGAIGQKNQFGFGSRQNLGEQEEKAKGDYLAELKKTLRPELLNRIDATVVFNKLSKQDMSKILELRLSELSERLKSRNLRVSLTPKAKEFLIEKGYDPNFGARPLNRAIQGELEDVLTDALLDGKVKEGDKVMVDLDKGQGKLTLEVVNNNKGTGAAAGLMTTGLVFATIQPLSGFTTVGSLLALALVFAWTMRHDIRALFRLGPKGFFTLVSPQKSTPGNLLRFFGKGWFRKVGLMAGVFLAADWGVKILVASLTSPAVWPDKSTFPFAYHDLSGRFLLLAFAVPFALGMILWARSRMKATEKLANKYPSLKKALSLYDVVMALALAGIIGNGVEGLVRGTVLDYIPIGGSSANLADFFIVFSMSFRLMMKDFFKLVGRSTINKEPVTFPYWKHFAIPVGAVFLGLMMRVPGQELLSQLALIPLVYGGLFGVGMLASSALVNRYARKFNRNFRLKNGKNGAAKRSLRDRFKKGGGQKIAQVFQFPVYSYVG